MNVVQEISELQEWMRSERFQYTSRPYSATDIARLRGSLIPAPISNNQARKLYALLREKFDRGQYTTTFGALDPVQVVQMSKYLECIYVSGWQCSSTASVTNEPGPDFADYPLNTVPNKVDQLFRAQLFHDRKQQELRLRMSKEDRDKTPSIDYLRPIIADGDTGFGGITSVMKLLKLHIQAGAAGVHIEDQRPGAKKCGHMGGKVLVPVQEQVERLIAARLQADIMGCETVLIARTDAASAVYLDSNIDPRDHPFIAGATNPHVKPLGWIVAQAQRRGISSEELNAIQQNWCNEAGLLRYTDAVALAIDKSNLSHEKKDALQHQWKKSMTLSHPEAKALATSLGFGDVFWCSEAPRAREGYYRVIGGTDYCIARALAFAPHADLLWMETSTPNLIECFNFSEGVHAKFPHQMLAYNLSPSFNWDVLQDQEIKLFQPEIAKMGFVWQFITLAGFHANALAVDLLAKGLAKDGVWCYVKTIQREERRNKVETLTHQRWSGAELCDAEMNVVSGGANSTASMSEGVTENQFHEGHSHKGEKVIVQARL